jgi:hypothetical protein
MNAMQILIFGLTPCLFMAALIFWLRGRKLHRLANEKYVLYETFRRDAHLTSLANANEKLTNRRNLLMDDISGLEKTIDLKQCELVELQERQEKLMLRVGVYRKLVDDAVAIMTAADAVVAARLKQ